MNVVLGRDWQILTCLVGVEVVRPPGGEDADERRDPGHHDGRLGVGDGAVGQRAHRHHHRQESGVSRYDESARINYFVTELVIEIPCLSHSDNASSPFYYFHQNQQKFPHFIIPTQSILIMVEKVQKHIHINKLL